MRFGYVDPPARVPLSCEREKRGVERLVRVVPGVTILLVFRGKLPCEPLRGIAP